MGMPLPRTDWTVAMLDDLPDDGNRYEIIDGELFVTPAPADRHQHAVGELYLLLAPYAKSIGVDLLFAPSAVRFSQRREVQPDIYARPRTPDGKRAERFADVGVVLLAVEILSPSTQRTDRSKKRVLYQQENVRDYWIADTTTRVIEQWTPESTEAAVQSRELIWQPVAEHPPLVIDVAQYFRDVWGE